MWPYMLKIACFEYLVNETRVACIPIFISEQIENHLETWTYRNICEWLRKKYYNVSTFLQHTIDGKMWTKIRKSL